ncbi:cellulose binding domain-containing protein [Thermomonospora umbrina]|uniref:cellulose binding domain-containing protein n=1 Tax=Thermomonospora umbrina TaxID=111806 RepID=UPI000E27731E|nr:cellulose binding domain-containing protein [Thermomonospora umbrina]
MSADEPGYVPPDHKTTAEFRIPERSHSGAPSGGAEDTMVDGALPDDRDPMEATAVDPVSEAPATVTDLPMDDVPSDLPTDDPEDVAVAPSAAVENEQGPGEWTEQFGQEEAGLPEATAPHPGLAKAAPAGPMAAAAAPPPDVPQANAQPAIPGPSPAVASVPPAGAGPEIAPPPAPDGATPPAGVIVGAPGGPFPPVASPVPGFQAGPVPPAGGSPNGSRLPLVVGAVVVLVLVVIGGAVAFALLSGDGDPEATTARPSASTGAGQVPPAVLTPGASGAPTPGATDPGPGSPPGAPVPVPSQGAPYPGQGTPGATPPPRAPIGPVVNGDGLKYQLVQRDPGYYEGLLIITNRGDRPMKEWTLTFEVPADRVKNVWGGELVRGGDTVEIRSLMGARPIPPGATFEVRFGAEGAPDTPGRCRFNDRSCGFE